MKRGGAVDAEHGAEGIQEPGQVRIHDMSFDLVRYKAKVQPITTDDLDFSAFGDQPLDENALRCIRYMHDIEFHTVCYLRDLLLSPAHRDPEITGFLSCWVFEEFWHGEALARVLAEHGELSGNARVLAVRRRLGWRNRARPAVMTIGSALLGEDFLALHMTWGALNEWTTQSGYALLAEKAGHPVLSELLRRIMRQEGRHIDFYATQARARLAASARARRFTRALLARFWRPVGSGVMPSGETSFLADYLMRSESGRAAAERIDRNLARLPGLEGLRLVESRIGL